MTWTSASLCKYRQNRLLSFSTIFLKSRTHGASRKRLPYDLYSFFHIRQHFSMVCLARSAVSSSLVVASSRFSRACTNFVLFVYYSFCDRITSKGALEPAWLLKSSPRSPNVMVLILQRTPTPPHAGPNGRRCPFIKNCMS